MMKTLTSMSGTINCSTTEIVEGREPETVTMDIAITNMDMITEIHDDEISMKMDAEIAASVKLCDGVEENSQKISMAITTSNNGLSLDYTVGEDSMQMTIKSDGDVTSFLSNPSKSYTLTNPETGESITIFIEASVNGENLFKTLGAEVDE